MARKKSKPKGNVVARNKRATFDYEILEKIEAGIALTGAETKSAKAGHMQLKGSFVSMNSKGAVLKNAYITPYKPAGSANESYDPNRDRELLLHKREIKRLLGKKKEVGLTIVPISVYIKRNLVKVEIGLGKGKKKYEKRDAIKKRDQDREVRTRMYQRGK